ncbi:hypothetical protein HYH03_004678 [Edaphochlamys debaryana]|uniref:Uncharacterized protein n=1 Tax=Edaphochlamys debaryana TaxID=47281 RepID=A0A836C268_9CHLO|nr:hypothetical protein HYH03_004678 [Edaphochlamys debaryana]|eukprot:KAG2497530.1 hypothetical protein HYH03_004678 [Edaphochlamys debaryana]
MATRLRGLLALGLAFCVATLQPALAQATANLTLRSPSPTNGSHQHVGLLPKGAPESEEVALDALGADHVEQVFIHRFSRILSNTTLRKGFDEALDIILAAPDVVGKAFALAPPSAQLLQDAVSGSEAAWKAIAISRAIAANFSTGAAGASPAAPLHDATELTAALAELNLHLSDLSAASCHPITRRVVLAALVRLLLGLHHAGGSSHADASILRSSPGLRRGLFRALRLLYNRHRQGAAAKGAIEFLHVSKSGGTSMCSVADRNGCSAESTTNYGNCMVRRFDDRPRWVSARQHAAVQALDGWRWYYRYLVRRGERPCEYRDEFMHRKRFTFYSNEFAAHGGLEPGAEADPAASSSPAGAHPPWASAHVCPQFLNVLMLRAPLARLASHLRWIIKVYRTEYGRAHEAFFRGRNATSWRQLAPAAVDNYYTRLLLGEAVYYAPPGSITDEHVAAARLVLLQFDVVLLLESGELDELWLRHALGWRVGLAAAHARSHGGAGRGAAEALIPADLPDLEAANEPDVRLYDFGVAVHLLDGLLFGAVAAAGLLPYPSFDQMRPQDAHVGRRVRCGFVTRRLQLLEGKGENASALDAALGRPYAAPFPRILSPDERVRGGAAEVAAALAAAGGPGQGQAGQGQAGQGQAGQGQAGQGQAQGQGQAGQGQAQGAQGEKEVREGELHWRRQALELGVDGEAQGESGLGTGDEGRSGRTTAHGISTALEEGLEGEGGRGGAAA